MVASVVQLIKCLIRLNCRDITNKCYIYTTLIIAKEPESQSFCLSELTDNSEQLPHFMLLSLLFSLNIYIYVRQTDNLI